ncbi:MAG: hypothetical protein WDO56_08500 [Gammaproteobacteria bacterium]
MRTPFRALAAAALFCLGTVGAAVAQAQALPADGGDGEGRSMKWEITPFVGYRMGGDFDLSGSTTSTSSDLDDHNSFGFAVNLYPGDHSESYELFYSRQQTSLASNSPLAPFDLNVEYLHIGGTLLVSDELPIAPYIGGGLRAHAVQSPDGAGYG